MPEYYPPVGLHFNVTFNHPDISAESTDSRFQEVSGLNAELKAETYAEGGENRFSHRFPTRAEYGNITLKRGYNVSSALAYWCRLAIEENKIIPINVTVDLLNENHEPLSSWEIVNAWPAKWSVSPFSAQDGKLVIESIDLVYNYFRRIA